MIRLLIGTAWFAWSSYRRACVRSARIRRSRLLPAAVGGDYFCGPFYTGGNACGELAKQAQEQKNQQVDVELQSVRQQVAMLGAQGYLLKSAIESGKIQFMVIPQNGNVSIPVPTPVQTPR